MEAHFCGSGLCGYALNIVAGYLFRSHSRILLKFVLVASTVSEFDRSGTLLLGVQSQVISSSCDCSLFGSVSFELTLISECTHTNETVEIQW